MSAYICRVFSVRVDWGVIHKKSRPERNEGLLFFMTKVLFIQTFCQNVHEVLGHLLLSAIFRAELASVLRQVLTYDDFSGGQAMHVFCRFGRKALQFYSGQDLL